MTSIHKDDYSFKKGDVVWAKVKGYPWWPGEIRQITIKQAKTEPKDKQTIYRINFIGDNTHVDVPKEKVENFEDKYAKYSQIKKKKLQKAIDKAKRMLKEKEGTVNNNKQSLLGDLSVNEDEKKKSVLINESDDDDVSNVKRTTQYIGFKRFPKGRNTFMHKRNNNIDKGNNSYTNTNCNAHSSNNINISININVTNNNHNTLNISSFKNDIHTNEPIHTTTINPMNTSINDDVYSHNNDESDDSSSSSSVTEEDIEERMKSLIENLLEYQIEVTNTSSHKCIINIINNIK